MAAEPDLLGRFRRLQERGQPDLFEGALLIAELIEPQEDLDAARRTVASLAARVSAAVERGEKPFSALCRVLFTEEGYRGDEESYDLPSNSSIARVLARRRGMPITLSIVAVEVARLSGLRLTGIGLPGHFVIGGPDAPEGMFLDAFDGGALYEAEGLSRRLASIFGSPVALPPEILAPDPPRAILSRVLGNLRRSYERRNRWEEALAALGFADALEPDDPMLWRERGLLLVKCGRPEEGIPWLERYVERAEGEDAETLRRLIASLRERAEGGAGGGASGEEDESDADEAKRVFTLDEARALLPRVKDLTSEAVLRYGKLSGELEGERESVVREWMREVRSLGVEIKGLWLVDFDSGAGYYCWKYPEPALNHFHGYEEGFAGRLPLT
ncbi:MAG TPA: tetratricopeptide repeat protein [Thermoanaerobaculia bacterium]